jgi:hypothetical protein
MPSLEEPIIFLKPPSSLLPNRGGPIRLPKDCDVHHEGTASIPPTHTRTRLVNKNSRPLPSQALKVAYYTAVYYPRVGCFPGVAPTLHDMNVCEKQTTLKASKPVPCLATHSGARARGRHGRCGHSAGQGAGPHRRYGFQANPSRLMHEDTSLPMVQGTYS